MQEILFIVSALNHGGGKSLLGDNYSNSLIRFGPFGRAIDFTLYNCLEAESGDVIVLTQDHDNMIDLYLSVQWRGSFSALGRKLDMASGANSPAGEYSGTADAIYQTLKAMSSLPEYVAVLSGEHIYRMDYEPMLDFHIEHGRSATMAVMRDDRAYRAGSPGYVICGGGGAVTGLTTDFKKMGDSVPLLASPFSPMDAHIFTTDELMDFLEANQDSASRDLGKDVLPNMIRSYRVMSFPFLNQDGQPGYFRRLSDLHCFWSAHIELLRGRLRDLRYSKDPGQKRPPASRFNVVREYHRGDKLIKNSMVSNMSQIGAATVIDSVICPGAAVEDGAWIEQSVIMDSAAVKSQVRLTGALVEPGVVIKKGAVEIDKAVTQFPLIEGIHQMMPLDKIRPEDQMKKPTLKVEPADSPDDKFKS